MDGNSNSGDGGNLGRRLRGGRRNGYQQGVNTGLLGEETW